MKPEYAIYIDLPDIADGVQAFRRGEFPQANWPQAKIDGWNMAGGVMEVWAMCQCGGDMGEVGA